MAENMESDDVFLARLLDCDLNQLPSIDEHRLQNEITRLATSASSSNHKYVCNKCNATFSHAKSLSRHLKKNSCSNIQKSFICQNCGKTYRKEACLATHTNRGKCMRPRKATAVVSNIQCDKCGAGFSKKANLKRHLLRQSCVPEKKDSIFECRICSKKFSTARTLQQHARTHAKATSSRNRGMIRNDMGDGDADGNDDDNNFDGDDDDDDANNAQSRRSLFQGTLIKYKLKAQEAEQQDLMYFFSNRRHQLRRNVIRELRRLKQVKWYVVVKIEMGRFNTEGDLVDVGTPVFRSFTRQVLVPDVVDSQIDEAYFKMLNSLDSFRADGSGWHIRKVIHMEQTVAKFRPLGGSCTLYQIPENLLRKRCILNITGPPDLDGHCFEYAVLAGLYTGEDVIGQLPWSELHQYRNVLKFDGLAGSGRYMPVTNIGEFEKMNLLSVNVYGYEGGDVFPIYVTETYRRERHVNLLLMSSHSDDDDDDVENFDTIVDHRKGHYCVVKNMSRLVSSQLGTEQVFICMRCLTSKRTAEALREHERLCSQDEEPVRCIMPGEKDKWMKFRNYGRRMKVSFVIVASFACCTVPLLANDEPTEGYEVRERRLDPCAFSYVRISVDNSHPKEPVFYRGTDPEDTMEHFLSAMAAEEEEVFSIVSQTAPVVWCDEGMANVEASNDICFVCGDPFLPTDRIAVDHSHVSGKYETFFLMYLPNLQ